MSNLSKARRAPVPIELDKTRHLKYTLYSFSLLEERYGSVDAGLKAIETGSMKAVIFMLWIGLIHEDEDLTERQVGNMIEIGQLEEISAKMNEVMGADLPEAPTKTSTNKGKK